MTKPTDPTTPTPVAIVSPQPTPVVDVSGLSEKLRREMEKEIMGLTAKLRWDHMPETLKDTWRVRIAELREALKGA